MPYFDEVFDSHLERSAVEPSGPLLASKLVAQCL